MQGYVYELSNTPWSKSADGLVVKEILAGDQEAFALLVRRYQRPLFRLIRGSLGEYDLACDIAQNVFLQFSLSLPTLRTDVPLRAWLYQVARRRCLDELRRKRAIPFSQMEGVEEDENLSPLAILLDPDLLPEEVIERQEGRQLARQAIVAAIEGLPPTYRAVVLLRSTGQLPFSAIGKTLHMPEATACHFCRPKERANNVSKNRRS